MTSGHCKRTHQGDTDSRNHSVGNSLPSPKARARFNTALPTAAN
jgi:hypothetical protein